MSLLASCSDSSGTVRCWSWAKGGRGGDLEDQKAQHYDHDLGLDLEMARETTPHGGGSGSGSGSNSLSNQFSIGAVGGGAGGVGCVTWNHNNQVLCTAGGDGHFALVHESGAVLDKFGATEGSAEPLSCVAFNSKSRYLLVGSQRGRLDMWDLKKKVCVRKFAGHSGSRVASAAFLSKDETVVSGGAGGAILLHKVRSGAVAAEIRPAVSSASPSHSITCIRVSPHSPSQLASSHEDGVVRFWNVEESGRSAPVVEWAASGIGINSLAYSPVNEKVVACAGSDGYLRLYDSRDFRNFGKFQKSLSCTITSISFHYGGDILAAGCADGSVHLVDLKLSGRRGGGDGDAVHSTILAHPGESVACIAWQHAPRTKGPSSLKASPGGKSGSGPATPSGLKRGREESAAKAKSNPSNPVPMPSGSSPSSKLLPPTPSAARSDLPDILKRLDGLGLTGENRDNGGGMGGGGGASSSSSAAAAAAADFSTSINRSMLKEVVAEVVESARVQLHLDVQNLHLDLLRQFQDQAEELASALESQTNRIASLIEENRELRHQNEELRRAIA